MKILIIVLIDIIVFTIGYVLGFIFGKNKYFKLYKSAQVEADRVFEANKVLQLELKKKTKPKAKTKVVKKEPKKEPKKVAVSTKKKPTTKKVRK